MKTVGLEGSQRASIGSKDAKSLRKEGQVPCVIYGGSENKNFQVDERHLEKLVFTPNVYIIKLNLSGEEVDAVIRDIQFHPVTDRVIHVDFMQLNEEKTVDIKLPVILKGNSIGVKNGGRLRFATKYAFVRALPSALPDNIEVDITKLRVGQSIKIGELSFAGLEFLDSPNRVVVAVRMAREVVIEDEEEEEGEGEEGVEAAEGEAKAEGGEAKAEEGAEEKKEEAAAE